MSNTPKCPACGASNTYFDGTKYVCAVCGCKWSSDESTADTADTALAKESDEAELS